MRLAALCLCCLLLAALTSVTRSLRAGSPPAGREEEAAAAKWPDSIKGIGQTLQKAEADAVQHALEELLARWRVEDSTDGWRPDVEFVRKYVLKGEGHRGEDEPIAFGGRTRSYPTWIYPLHPFPAQTLRYFAEKEARAERGAERHVWAGIALGGITLGAAVALAFLHLRRRFT